MKTENNPVFQFISDHFIGLISCVVFYILIRISDLKVNPLIYSFVIFFIVLAGVLQNKKLLILFTSVINITILIFSFLYNSRSIPNNFNISSSAKPNILTIVLDTARKKSFSIYGYKRQTTTNRDQLARNSIVFENAFSTSAWTAPAMGSFFTGKFLNQDNIHLSVYPLQDQGIQLGEYLKNLGYDTAVFSANDLVSEIFSLARGYSYVEHSMPGSTAPVSRLVVS